MKKHLLFLFTALTLLLVPTALKAQTTVTIGDGSTSYYYLPVNTYYNYSLTQQIYTAAEINMPNGGTITSISFDYAYNQSFTMSGVRVYMKNVSKNTFEDGDDIVEVSYEDKVFEGTFSASGAGWVTLTLSTPFHYDGTSNLLVCFYDPTSGYPGSSYKFRTTSTASDQYPTLAWYSDSYCPDLDDLSSYTGNKDRLNYRNNIQMTINPDITEINITGFTEPAWGEHPDYTWEIPSDANYYIQTDSKWQDLTTSSNLFAGNVFNQEGHEYALTYHFKSIYGYHFSPNVTVKINGNTTLVKNKYAGNPGYYAQTVSFMVEPEVTIGEGTGTTYVTPYNSFWNYSFVEQLYTADEIGVPDGGEITAIKFNMSSYNTHTNHITVYMKAVSRSEFANKTDYEQVTAGDIVYDGTYTFTQGWNTITLAMPFNYNGTDNLMVAIHENTSGFSTRNFYCTQKTNSVISFHSDNADPNPYNLASYTGSKYVSDNRADIRLVIPATTVNDGTVTNNYVPVYGFYADAYLKAEFVIPANSLTSLPTSRDLTSMTFYASQSDVSWGDANFIVFLKEVAGTTLSDFTGYDDATTVYEGSLSIVDGKMTVPFTTPYTYNGGNLLVGVYNTVEGLYATSSWLGVEATGASVQGYSYGSLDEVTATQRDFLPKTTFTFTNQMEPTAQIGEGTSTNTYLPTYIFYNYSLSEQIYTASEIGRSGDIYTIAFYNTGDARTRNIDIYMANTYKSSFSDASDWVAVGSSNKVFSGEVNFLSNEWTTIELTNPFHYSSAKNLLLVVDDNTGSYQGSVPFLVFDAPNQALHYHSDNTNLYPFSPNYSGQLYNVKNQIQLGFDLINPCEQPTNLTVSNITYNSADVEWTGNGEAYMVKYRPIIFSDDFENGLGQWTQIDADGDGFIWGLGSVKYSGYTINSHEGSDMVCSESYDGNTSEGLYPNNYLITPQVTLGGVVSFWAQAQDQSYPAEHFGIAVSTTSNTDATAFTTIAEWTMEAGDWRQYTVDLSDYAGQTGYVALRHFNCYDQFFLNVDDFIIYDSEDSWVTTVATTNNVHIDGLAPSTSYQVMVKSGCGSNGTSDWSEILLFHTTVVEEVTVFDGTDNSSYVPVHGFYAEDYLKAEYIMNASELSAMNYGDITKMTFYATQSDVSWGNANFKVFLKEVPNTTLSNYTGFNNSVLVYEGPLSIVNGQMTVNFTTPYTYNGHHLLVGVYNTVKGTFKSCTWIGTTVSGASVQGYSYQDLDHVATNQRNFVPKTTFQYVPGTAPSCPKPFNLAVNNVSFNGAELSWIETGTATNWIIEYSTASDFSGATVATATSTPTYSLSGLSDGTTYYVRVKANCGGGDESLWSNHFSFTTPERCPTPSNLSYSNVGKYSATLSWTENGEATAWQICLNGNESSPIDVTENPYTLTDLTPNMTHTVKVRANCGGSDGVSAWCSSRSFTTLPSCIAPSGLVVSNVGQTSATIGWTENDEATEWQICLNGDVSNPIDVTENPYTLTGLNVSETYTVNVRANCGGSSGVSNWSSTKSFTTLELCPAPFDFSISNLTPNSTDLEWTGFGEEYTVKYRPIIFSDDFENGLGQWTLVDNDGDGHNWFDISTTGSIYTYYSTLDLTNWASHGSNAALSGSYINGVGILTPDNWLITPQIPLGGLVSFNAKGTDASYPAEHFAIYVSTTGTNPADFTQVSEEFIATGTSENYTADLSSYNGQQGYVAIRHFNATDVYILSVDDFVICDDTEPWETTTVTTENIHIDGLTPSTSYQVMVQSDCGSDGTSGWSDIFSFRTSEEEVTVYDGTANNGYVPVYGLYTDAYLKAEYIMNASELTAMNYGDITGMTFYSATSNTSWGSANFKVFLKEVSNTTLSNYTGYDNAVVVYEGPLSIVNGQMTVNFTTPYTYNGDHLLVGVYNTVQGSFKSCYWIGTNVDGASVQGYSYDDLDLVSTDQRNFVPKTTFQYVTGTTPSCPRPIGLTANNITYNGAELSWTETGTATNWIIEYGTASDFSGATMATVTTTPSYILSGLSDGTTYYVRVKANCGGGDESTWNNTFSFTTPERCPTPSNLAYSNVGKYSATLSWTENGEATAWKICLNGDESNPIDVTENPYTLTGLTPNTIYTVKVRANCGGSDGVSAWSSETQFTTISDIVISSLANWYGYSTSSNDVNHTKFISFTMDNPTVVTAATNVQSSSYRGAAYANGYLWALTSNGKLNRATVDNANKTISSFETIEPGLESSEPSSLSYNPMNGMMYYTIWNNQTLKMFDPTHPEIVTVVGTLGITPITFAINSSGEAYCIEKTTGDLYRIDLSDASTTLIGSTGITNNYVQSMAFDLQTNELFWAQYYKSGIYNSGLYKVDPATATTYYLGILGGGSVELTSLFMVSDIPVDICYAPSNLTVSHVGPTTAELSWTDNSSATEWQICLNGDEDNLITATTNPYTLTGLTPETSYTVKVRANCGGALGESYWSGVITFTTTGPCPAPVDLLVSNVSPTSAELSWTDLGGATEWQICVDGNESDLITVNTTSYTLTGLTPETTHTVKVKANCGSDGISVWSNVGKFATISDISVNSTANWYAYAYNLSYEAGNYTKLQRFISFSMQNPETISFATETLYSSGTSSYAYATAYANGYVWCVTRDGRLTRATVNDNTATISDFETLVDGFSSTIGNSMSYNPVDGKMYYVTGSELVSFNPSNPVGTKTVIGSFSEIIPFTIAINRYGEAYITDENTDGFYALNLNDASYSLIGHSGVVGTGSYQDMAFDMQTDELFLTYTNTSTHRGVYKVDPTSGEAHMIGAIGNGYGAQAYSLFMVSEVTPPCPAPTDLVAGNITKHSAELNWTETGTATEWQIMVNHDEENIIDVYGNPYILENLTAETEYTVMVRANCGGVFSDWSNEALILTEVGCPATEDLTMMEFSSTSAILNWTGEGESFNLQYRTTGGEWVEIENVLPPYTLTGLMPNTSYEVVVVNNCGTEGLSLWSNMANFTTSDCPVPTELTVSNTTKHTAVLSWNENGSATEWQIMVNNDEGNLINVTANPYILENLAAETEYTVVVRANCGGSAWSTWSNEAHILTEVGCQATNDLAMTAVTPNTVTLNWSGEGETYDLQLKAVGDEWVLVENVLPPYTINDLEPNTNYEVQVMNDCGTEGTSLWSNVVTFTTAAQIIPTVLEISGDTTVCSGSTTTLTATSDVEVTYAWSTGETTASITVGAGEYSVTVTSATGNELSESVTVTLKANYYVNNYNSVCSSELPFEWLGSSYSEGGSYVKTFTTVDGCDSVVRLYLTVYYPENEVIEISACGSYTWADGNGETYNESGDYTYAHQDANGCTQVDTLRLTILLPTEGSDERTICSSELPYTWNGVIFEAAGVQTATLEGANGCDSVVTMTLNVNQVYNTPITGSICSGDAYNFFGQLLTTSGEYTHTLEASNGCDSVVVLTLTVNSTYSVTEERTVCSIALPYTWNGVLFTGPATKYATLQSVNGCDSLVTMTLSVSEAFEITETRSVCVSELPIVWNGKTFTEAGTQTTELTASNGCDSIVTMVLTVNTPVNVATTIESCGSYTWEANGETYTASNTYTYEHPDANGCTQVDTLHLTIYNPVNTAITETVCGSFTWTDGNGVTYTESGTYTYEHQDAHGCSQVDTLYLTIFPTYSLSEEQTVCPSALPYTWNGVIFEAAGVQTATLQTVNGCDSVVTMTLNLNDAFEVTEPRTVCASELPIVWNGKTFTEAGTQTAELTASNGCDSIVTMVLTVNTPVNTATTAEACGSYTWAANGQTYTVSNTYTYEHPDANGCTQVDTLHLTIYNPVNTAITETVCGSFTWTDGNGVTYTESGTYTYEHQDAHGCSQVDTLYLTIFPTYSLSEEQTVCPSALPYTWNGVIFEAAGVQTATLQTVNGCDSVVTMTLHVNPSYIIPVEATICSGQTYNFYGQILTASGEYTHPMQTVDGCDSVEVLTLTVNPTYSVSEERAVCSGALPYTWNGIVFNAPGTKFATLQTVNGCDSVVTMILSVSDAYEVTVNRTVCASELPIVWNGKTFTGAGTQIAELEAGNGCDSIVTMVLTVNTPVNTATTAEACGSYTWAANGQTYTESGTHYYEHPDAHGCTQVDTLYLTINNPVNTAITEESCGSYTWAANGETYTVSGTHYYEHPDAHGCTQVDTLYLTIYNPVNTATTAEACGSFTWSADGETYTESGTHYYEHPDAHGCTQVDTLYLTINNPVNTVTTEESCGNYTWAANGQTYYASGEYTYSHQNANGCTQVDTLRLTILQGSSAVVANTICASELPYEWNGVTFTAAGMQTATIEAANGCDSVITMVLMVNTPVNTESSAAACESYTWAANGVTYYESGEYTYAHPDINGCTQVDTLHLTIYTPEHTAITVAECGSYSWTGGTGITYTESGEYTYAHTDAHGCTQVDTLHLTIYTPEHTAITVAECGSYSWTGGTGITYTESGTYYYEHQDAHGCTQVDTLYLTIYNPVAEVVEASACGSYTWAANGQTYAVSGEYTYAHTDAHGCTQVDTLRLTILQGSSAVLTSTICASELPYVWNGVTFTEAGMQTTTLTAVNGCDSVVTMVLTVNAPPVNTAITATECSSYTWAANGQTYYESGTYTYSHPDVNGCTQVDTLYLTINHPVNTAITVSECGSYTWNGQTYTTSGVYTYSHTDANGCTQVDTLYLTISQSVQVELYETACGSYTWNGQTYTQSNDYSATFTAANGCDSIVVLHLTVYTPANTAITVEECDSYTWTTGNGQTYTTSGDYTYSHEDANGCTQVDTLHLTIHYATTSEFTIETPDSCYTWNGQSYCASGDYVQTLQTVNGCDSVVTLHLTTSVGVSDHEVTTVFLAPNPTQNICRIMGLETDPVSVDLYDMRGKLVMKASGRELDVTTLPTGLYMVKVFTGDRFINLKLVKQ